MGVLKQKIIAMKAQLAEVQISFTHLVPLIRPKLALGAIPAMISAYLSISTTFSMPISIKCRTTCNAIRAAAPLTRENIRINYLYCHYVLALKSINTSPFTIIRVIAPYSITTSHN